MSEISTIRTTYKVSVKHPTDYHKGMYTVVVIRKVGKYFPKKEVSVDSTDFGCGRDQFNVTDEQAISSFLSEHACRVLTCEKLEEKSY